MEKNKTALMTRMKSHAVVYKVLNISHFLSLCISMCLCASTYVQVWLQMRKRWRKSDELSHIRHPSAAQWFMGLITESIHKPAVLFFRLWWDDRNTTDKPPICSVPSSFKNLYRQSFLASVQWVLLTRTDAQISYQILAMFELKTLTLKTQSLLLTKESA